MGLPLSSRAHTIYRERQNLLRRVSRLLDTPMTVLSFLWLGLMIVDFTSGLSPFLDAMNYLLWGLFVLHFALEFWIAPEKLRYLRTNWLTALALVLPAFRMLRIFRAFRALQIGRVGRGLRLVRWMTSLNRGMRAAQKTVAGRGLTYVLLLTLIINFAGAAAMCYFENPRMLAEDGYASGESPGLGIRSYGESLWWTSMMLTTMGSDYFPKTVEGRVVALLLAIYAFAMFGYITATVASLIIHVDRPDDPATGSVQQQLAALQAEITALRRQLGAPAEPGDLAAPER
jgi:voltage-gated potassium channel